MSYKLNNLTYVLLINSGSVASILIVVYCRYIKEVTFYYSKIVLSCNYHIVVETDYSKLVSLKFEYVFNGIPNLISSKITLFDFWGPIYIFCSYILYNICDNV